MLTSAILLLSLVVSSLTPLVLGIREYRRYGIMGHSIGYGLFFGAIAVGVFNFGFFGLLCTLNAAIEYDMTARLAKGHGMSIPVHVLWETTVVTIYTWLMAAFAQLIVWPLVGLWYWLHPASFTCVFLHVPNQTDYNIDDD